MEDEVRRDKKERKPKLTNKEREDQLLEQRLAIAREIFLRWKARRLQEKKGITPEKARKKAKERWARADSDKKTLYFRVACVECQLLKRHKAVSVRRGGSLRRKEEYHQYLLFCRDNRETVKSAGFFGNEVMKELSRRWKLLDEPTKQLYHEKAQANKNRDLKK